MITEISIRNLSTCLFILSYAPIVATIPKTDARINTHFQQFSLFIFMFLNLITVKIHPPAF